MINTYPPVDNTLVELKVLRIPIQLQYEFSDSRIKPYLGLGTSINYWASIKFRNENLLILATGRPLNQRYYFNGIQRGFNIDGGFKIKINPKYCIDIGLDCEYMFRYFGYVDDNSYNINNESLNLIKSTNSKLLSFLFLVRKSNISSNNLIKV